MTEIQLSPTVSVTPTRLGVLLRTDLGTFQVTGGDAHSFLDVLLPLLDGSRDRAAILRALDAYSTGSVTALLDRLTRAGLVEAVNGVGSTPALPQSRSQDAFFQKWAVDATEADARLAEARVLVFGLSPWSIAAAKELAVGGIGALDLIADDVANREGKTAEAMPRGLVAETLLARAPRCRVEHRPTSSLWAGEGVRPWSLLVASVDPRDTVLIERVATFAHDSALISLWAHSAGMRTVLGPLVTPGQTACRVCATDPALNPAIDEIATEEQGPQTEIVEQILGHRVALEAIKLIAAYTSSTLGGRVAIHDLATFESSRYTLVRIPWCRVCGTR